MRLLTLIITASLIFCSGVALAQRYAISSSIANIRSGPGTQYDILWQVERYYPVQVIEKVGKWFRFHDFEGDEGWIHASLLRNIPSVITMQDKCNLRSGPGTKFNVVDTALRGVPFKVLKRKGGWLFVQHADGDKAWIHKSLVW